MQVFLAGWEVECCQPPPGEGDRVEWPLLWTDDPSGPGEIERDRHVRGSLWADLHGGSEQVPLTRGTVRGVRVVEQAYRLTGRGYEPVDSAFTLRPVDRSPTWFAGRPCDEDPPTGDLRQESGVLVGPSRSWGGGVNEDTDGDWAVIGRDAGWRELAFQRAEHHQPPRWPDPEHPQQEHLDIRVDDVDAAEQAGLALGATKLPAEHEDGFRVFADPAGHPFCLVHGRGHGRASGVAAPRASLTGDE